MLDLPNPKFAPLSDDSDAVLRLHAENPFFKARSQRYQAIDALITELQAEQNPTRPTLKLLISLKLRRDKLLAEMVEMVADTQDQASITTLWRQPTQPAWRWS